MGKKTIEKENDMEKKKGEEKKIQTQIKKDGHNKKENRDG